MFLTIFNKKSSSLIWWACFLYLSLSSYINREFMKRIILIVGLSLFVIVTRQTYKVVTKFEIKDAAILNIENPEINKSKQLDLMFKSIAYVESKNGIFLNDTTHDAIGIIQIRPVMITEVNRIIGYDKYSLDDRWNHDKSFEIFKIYQDYYNPNYHLEKGIRIWNGGPTGHKKTATLIYLKKVLLAFDRING